jgi:putative ABC transport system substrate-binding protein
MRRRTFIAGIGGVTVAFWPLSIRAQTDRVPLIGVLIGANARDPEIEARMAALNNGLEKLGWIAGRNIRIEYRLAGGDAERFRSDAADLVGLKPDVLVAASGTPLAALHRETRTIPIVFVQAPDPVGGGFVMSLARPGGNVTGFSQYEYVIAGKWLELLKQIAPSINRASAIHDPLNPGSAGYLRAIQTVAAPLGVQVTPAPVHSTDEVDLAVAALAPHQTNSGLIVAPGPATSIHRERIIAQAAQYRLPAVYPFRYFAVGGGLASYGVDNKELFRRAATYVDRILKGEKPSDLPVQLADKYELVINLKTAKALGIEVPVSVLARTDEVIE